MNAKWYQAWSENFPVGRAMSKAELAAAKTRNAAWLKEVTQQYH